MNPLVSIYIPVYNGERYLSQTLDSIISQTFKNFEVVIVDDGSTDETNEIAIRYSKSDSRIRLVSHGKNLGLSAARNTGWKSTNSLSRYLMNHDSDDISLPNKLESLVDFLERNNNISAVGSFCDYIDADSKVIRSTLLEWKPKLIRATFGIRNSMAISATLVRRSLYDAMAPFQSDYGGCDDYDFWSRALIANYELANIPKVLHQIRLHQMSFSKHHSAAMLAQEGKIQKFYIENLKMNELEKTSSRIIAKTLRYRNSLRRSFHTES